MSANLALLALLAAPNQGRLAAFALRDGEVGSSHPFKGIHASEIRKFIEN